jgi:hypothetical protein
MPIGTEYTGRLCRRRTGVSVGNGVSAKCTALLSRKCTVHVQLRTYKERDTTRARERRLLDG